MLAYAPDRFMPTNNAPAPPPQFGNSCRMLANILFSQTGDSPMKVLLFVGAAPGVGVTTIISNFGLYLAEHLGQRVLLTDACQRRPHLHELYGLSSKQGFSEALAERDAPDERTLPNAQGLYVMPAGAASSLGKNLWALRGGLKRRLRELSEGFDWMLIDADPIATSPESFTLASQADGVVLVAQAGKTRKELLAASKEQLGLARANLVGAVLNRRRFHIPAWLYRRMS